MSRPTPWSVVTFEALGADDKTPMPVVQINDANGDYVLRPRGKDAAELAGLIVRAVNAQADKGAELRDAFALAIVAGSLAGSALMELRATGVWSEADRLVKARP